MEKSIHRFVLNAMMNVDASNLALNTDTWRIGYFGSTTLELENTLTSTLVVINTYMSGPLTFAIVLPPLYQTIIVH